MADLATYSELATAAGTLVLAVATFAAVRSSNQSARVAERALLAGLRPLLLVSRMQDPAERVDFADGVVMKIPGGMGAVQHEGGAVLMAISLRNVGTGLALLRGWRVVPGRAGGEVPHGDPETDFRWLIRDIYVSAGDTGFWQGAIRDADDPDHGAVRAAVEQGSPLTVEVLYTDQEQARRFISRFALTQGERGWMAASGRTWGLDDRNA